MRLFVKIAPRILGIQDRLTYSNSKGNFIDVQPIDAVSTQVRRTILIKNLNNICENF